MSESNSVKHFQVRKTNPQGDLLLGTQCADGVIDEEEMELMLDDIEGATYYDLMVAYEILLGE